MPLVSIRVVLKPDAARGCSRRHILEVLRPEAIRKVGLSVAIGFDATEAPLEIVLPGITAEVLPDSPPDLSVYRLEDGLTFGANGTRVCLNGVVFRFCIFLSHAEHR